MTGFLRIVTWNANGLRRNLPELEAFLNLQKIDICCVSETHLTAQTVVKITGFEVYSTPHPANQARGGSAIIIRANVRHHEEEMYQTDHLQASIVRVETPRYKFTVAAVYCPPRHNTKEYEYLSFLNKLGNTFIAGGDWNAKHVKWGSRLTNTKGRELYNAGSYLTCNFMSQGTPTYWPTDSNKVPDILDFFIVRGLSRHYIKVDNCLDLSSDHSPVIMTLSEFVITESLPTGLTNKCTDWNMFREQILHKLSLSDSHETRDELETDAKRTTKIIQDAATQSTPERKKTLPGKNYPLEIKQLILEKRRARRRWQNFRSPERKAEYNRLTNQLSKTLNYLRNLSFTSYLENLSPGEETNYSLYKATKRLKNPIVRSSPIKKNDGCWARSCQEKADLHADHLESVFQPNAWNVNPLPTTGADEADNTPIRHVTPREVEKTIQELIKKKSAGPDKITPTILKELPFKAMVKLTHLFNAAIRLRYVPAEWKVAEVITILKPGKPECQVTSYRPISLLNVVSKVFEKIISKRLNEIILERNLIPNHQFGFRPGHSTIDQVSRICNFAQNALDQKRVCSAVFLDVAQAFDKVWHEGLNYKLRNCLPKPFSDILKSYLEGRTFKTRIQNSFSTVRKINAGVPQGSVLGPTLYLLYTADIPTDKNTMLATFADDTAILAHGINTRYATMKLQAAVNRTNAWMHQWKIKLNQAKSQHINFTKKRGPHIPLFIDQQVVPNAGSAKYLGLTLDSKLRWKAHIDTKIRQLKILSNKMKMLTGRRSRLSLSNKLLVYKQIIKPVWTYGLELWGKSAASNIKPMQTSINNILRIIVRAPYYCRNADIRRDLHLKSIMEERHVRMDKYQARIATHPNSLVRRLND